VRKKSERTFDEGVKKIKILKYPKMEARHARRRKKKKKRKKEKKEKKRKKKRKKKRERMAFSFLFLCVCARVCMCACMRATCERLVHEKVHRRPRAAAPVVLLREGGV
jgi:hypothetical protein